MPDRKKRRQLDYDNPFGPEPGTADSYYVDQYLRREDVQRRRSRSKFLSILLVGLFLFGIILFAAWQLLLVPQTAKFSRSLKREFHRQGLVERKQVADQPVEQTGIQLTVSEVNKILSKDELTVDGLEISVDDTVHLSLESPLGEIKFNGIPETAENGNPLLPLDDITVGGVKVPAVVMGPLINSLTENGLPIAKKDDKLEVLLDHLASEDGSSIRRIDFDLANGLINIDADIGEDSTLRQYLP